MAMLKVTRRNGIVDIRITRRGVLIERNFRGSRLLTNTDDEPGNGVFNTESGLHRFWRGNKKITIMFPESLPTEPKNNAAEETWRRWMWKYNDCLTKRVSLVNSAADDFDLDLEIRFL